MLIEIAIKNYAIIDTLNLEFFNGTTVLTGETGAGKSIIIDAVELALGARLSGNVVRTNADRAEITLSFNIANIPTAKTLLKKYDLESTQDCIIRRVIDQDGRSKSYVNGTPTTLQILRELGDTLIDIHGQHEFQTLLKPDIQLMLLDRFAQHADLLSTLNQAYDEWKKARTLFDELKKRTTDIQARIEFLTYQVHELGELKLSEHELESIEAEHQQLAHIDTLLSQGQKAFSLLSEKEDGAAKDLLYETINTIETMLPFDPSLKNISELVQNAATYLDEAAHELKHFLGRAEANPERLNELNQRLVRIHQIAKKHRVNPQDLYAFHQQMKKELNESVNSDERLAALEKEIETLQMHYTDSAKKLTQNRKKTAKRLNQLITDAMRQLGMPHGRFEIVWTDITDQQPRRNGLDKIEFKISTNPDQPVQPLNKVASGGELSRISLAIQVSTAQQQTMPTLIFDEVDVGIGGATAEIVGKLLKALGESTQVLCITHLAQVAAKGHRHLKVEKKIAEGKTITQIDYLEQEDRITEIARMAGGVKITPQTLAYAKEMMV